MSEWFINDSSGLEQGWTICQPPPGESEKPIALDLTIRGNLIPQIGSDDSMVGFLDASSSTVINYSGLKAWDADGKSLYARFELSVEDRGRLRISVEAQHARYPVTIDPIAQHAYLKASNPGVFDYFGGSVAASGDTVVIGASGENGTGTGINPAANDIGSDCGAVYVFVRSGSSWVQQAYLKASNTGWTDKFGGSVAISGDTIVVGATGEDSDATGVNGNEGGYLASNSGAAYVFVRNGGTWSQQAYLKASNTGDQDHFGTSVSISGDTIVVGAPGEDGAPGAPDDDPGAAYVFARVGTTWEEEAYLRAPNADASDFFGGKVAVSGDHVVVGAFGEDGGAKGVNGNMSDNSASAAGAAYVYSRNGGGWTFTTYLKASNAEKDDWFGDSLAISGNTIVVGAQHEGSSTKGINGNQANNSALFAGAVYVFVNSGGSWTQQAYLKASNTDSEGGWDRFGYSVEIEGDTLVVGAPFEDSSSRGVNGSQTNNIESDSGAAYVFTRTGSVWSQQAYLKASNTDALSRFGGSLGLSNGMVVIGASHEDSASSGVNGNQSDQSLSDAGAAYVYYGLGPPPPPDIAVATNPEGNLVSGVGTIDLGSMGVGEDSIAKQFIVSNQGSGTLKAVLVAKGGANAGDFVIDSIGTKSVLNPGEETSFAVRFRPLDIGRREVRIEVFSNDPDENPFIINVFGNGTPQTVGFGAVAQSRIEDAVTISVPVVVSGAIGKPFTLPLTIGGSARRVEDFNATASPLKVSGTQTVANVTINLKDDLIVEGNETVQITLGAPSTTAVNLDSNTVFTLTIVEDDVMPVVAPDLINRIVAAGTTVTFASGATGSAPLALKWKKGTATLPGETGTSLVLPPATLAAAAAYTFSATNQRGSDSSTAELAVVDRSDAIIRANPGTSPKLSVAAKGNRVTYRWRDVNGDLSPMNPKYAGVTTATLTLKDVGVGDTGHYTCRVTAPGGTLDSGDRFLQVPSVKPTAITPAFPDVVIHNAFSYQLTFNADASRAPTRFLCTGLPKGLTCHPTTGLISGKPTETGDFTVVVTMSNSADTADTVQDTFKVLAYPSGAVGSYLGVIGRNTKANADLGGRIDLTTTPLGGYTGTLKLGSTSLRLSGTLATAPTAGAHPGVTITLARNGRLPVVLMVDIDPATNDLIGSVYEQGESGSNNIVGWRNVWPVTTPTQQGAHSFKIDPALTGPQGFGFGTIAVGATGVTTLKGQTADGGVVISSGFLGPDGEVLVYALMLGNKASLVGTLAIDGDSNHTINSTLSWQKTAVTKSREYAPFGPFSIAVTGGTYIAEGPALGLTDAGVNNAQFLFSDAGVPSLTNPNVAVYINATNKVTLSDTNPGGVKLLSFNVGTGAFTGQFTLKDAPAAPRTVKFQGWLVPTESRGYGYFLLPQLASPPATTASNSPILSGKVVLE